MLALRPNEQKDQIVCLARGANSIKIGRARKREINEIKMGKGFEIYNKHFCFIFVCSGGDGIEKYPKENRLVR